MKKAPLATRLAGPLALLAFGGMHHRGSMFTIEFPDGWSAPATDKDGIATSNGPADARVLCNAPGEVAPAGRLWDSLICANLSVARGWMRAAKIDRETSGAAVGDPRVNGWQFSQRSSVDQLS